MSLALRGRRAVAIASLSLISAATLALVPAAARGGAPAAAPGARPVAAPMAPAPRVNPSAVQRPAFPPIRAQAPAAQRPRYGVYQQGQDWRQHWRRPGALPGYTRLPSTLPANAAWPQQRIRQSPDAALPAPQIIYAPQAASGPAEPPLDFTHGEPPLDYAYAEPCAAPLLIHIGAPAQAPAGVRVVHAQASPCGAPQAVVYRGPKIVRIEPQAGVRTVGRTSAHRHAAKPAQRGFKVVRVRK